MSQIVKYAKIDNSYKKLNEKEFNEMRFVVKYLGDHYVSLLSSEQIIRMPATIKVALLDMYRFINSEEINELTHTKESDLIKLQRYKSVVTRFYDYAKVRNKT